MKHEKSKKKGLKYLHTFLRRRTTTSSPTTIIVGSPVSLVVRPSTVSIIGIPVCPVRVTGIGSVRIGLSWRIRAAWRTGAGATRRRIRGGRPGHCLKRKELRKFENMTRQRIRARWGEVEHSEAQTSEITTQTRIFNELFSSPRCSAVCAMNLNRPRFCRHFPFQSPLQFLRYIRGPVRIATAPTTN